MVYPEFVFDELSTTIDPCRTCEHFLGVVEFMLQRQSEGTVTEGEVRDRMDLLSSRCALAVVGRSAARHDFDMPEREALPIEDCNLPSGYKNLN